MSGQNFCGSLVKQAIITHQYNHRSNESCPNDDSRLLLRLLGRINRPKSIFRRIYCLLWVLRHSSFRHCLNRRCHLLCRLWLSLAHLPFASKQIQIFFRSLWPFFHLYCQSRHDLRRNCRINPRHKSIHRNDVVFQNPLCTFRRVLTRDHPVQSRRTSIHIRPRTLFPFAVVLFPWGIAGCHDRRHALTFFLHCLPGRTEVQQDRFPFFR